MHRASPQSLQEKLNHSFYSWQPRPGSGTGLRPGGAPEIVAPLCAIERGTISVHRRATVGIGSEIEKQPN
jgi:hypothetical protein